MRRYSKKGLLTGAAAAASAILVSLFPHAALAQPVMKIGLATINDVQHEFAKQFAAEMQKQAPGKMKVEVYPADQLGAAPRLIEGLTLGTVEGWMGPPEFLVGQDPRYQIMGAPGVVKDIRHGQRLLSDPVFRDAFLSFADAKGIKGLGAIIYGPNIYGTRKPVRTMADFKGLKIRVFGSPMHTLAMERLGASGVPMPPADALVAIGSGAIDGNRTGMNVLVAFKYFDVIKYATQIEGDAMIFVILAIGKSWFDKLPADTQKAMLSAVRAAEQHVANVSIEGHMRGETTWRERGAELIKIGGAEQAEFVKRMLKVGDEVVGKNPRIKDAYTLMLNRANATR
jgi:C4-dicarboxylate-binding protein DctP